MNEHVKAADTRCYIAHHNTEQRTHISLASRRADSEMHMPIHIHIHMHMHIHMNIHMRIHMRIHVRSYKLKLDFLAIYVGGPESL